MDNAVTSLQVIPANNMAEVMELGTLFEKSAMFGCTNPGQGAVLVLTCKCEGLSPVEFMRKYDIIEGKLRMKADYMAAEYARRGGKCKIVETTAARACALFTFGDNSIELEETIEQAKEKGLLTTKDGKDKGTWKKYPQAMLWARLMSKAVRLLAPGVNAGVYTPEEGGDFEDQPAETPRRVQTVRGMVATSKMAPAAAATATPPAEPAAGTVSAATPADKKGAITVPAAETPAAAPAQEQAGSAPAADLTSTLVMPLGKLKGKRFDEMDLPTLKFLMTVTDKPELTADHKLVIEGIIATRGEGK